MFLRQSTSQLVEIGPFTDFSDGVTEEVALTIANTDVRLSKDGATWVNKNSGGATHREDGWYDMTLDATDTATVGILKWKVQDPLVHVPVWGTFFVLEEAVYDALFDAGAEGPLQGTTPGNKLDVTAAGEAGIDLDNTVGTLVAAQFGANFLTAAKIATAALTAAKFGVGAIDAAALATDAVDEIVAAVWDRLLTGGTHNITDSAGKRLRQVGALFVIDSGTAQAGGTATITLAATASAVDDIYNGDRVVIVGGTGASEHGIITAYDGGTQIATMSEAWTVQPDGTSEYEVTPATVDVHTWQHQIVTVTGVLPNVNVGSIDTDAVDANALATDAVDEIRDAVLPVRNAIYSNLPVMMVDSTDHVTAKTGLTLTVTRSIDGGAFGAGTGTATEISAGFYQYDTSAADVDGTLIIFRFEGTAADDTFVVLRTGG